MEIAWSVVSKLIIGLISLLIVVRILGRKSLAQITPYDFVYTLVLGGVYGKIKVHKFAAHLYITLQAKKGLVSYPIIL